jgi:hypothetical protein
MNFHRAGTLWRACGKRDNAQREAIVSRFGLTGQAAGKISKNYMNRKQGRGDKDGGLSCTAPRQGQSGSLQSIRSAISGGLVEKAQPDDRDDDPGRIGRRRNGKSV